jgi:hypothetical protein
VSRRTGEPAKARRFVSLACFALSSVRLFDASLSAQTLTRRLDSLLDAPPLNRHLWGVAIADSNGRTIFARRPALHSGIEYQAARDGRGGGAASAGLDRPHQSLCHRPGGKRRPSGPPRPVRPR